MCSEENRYKVRRRLSHKGSYGGSEKFFSNRKKILIKERYQRPWKLDVARKYETEPRGILLMLGDIDK